MNHIAFIGAGNIARAILGGYLAANPDAEIYATDPIETQLENLPEQVHKGTDNVQAVQQAEVIMLCVKPNMMADLCGQLAQHAANKLFISVAAGITTENLRTWLGEGPAIVRCMPNTPALVGNGMTGLFASAGTKPEQRQVAAELLGAVGEISWFDSEADLDIVTAVSGSGPAYFFLLIEAMQEAAISMGLTPEVARQLSEQTALGAAKMAVGSELAASTLRENVTSPGGTTAAALEVFASEGFKDTVARALQAAEKRSKELSLT
ncbi:MAG: pyrroline-5-carboxylate reductase [Pseudomonadales bacterium]